MKFTEVKLDVAELDNPLRSLHDRLTKSVFLDEAKESNRKSLRSYLASVFSSIGESVPLKAERIVEIADLLGEGGVSYLRWLLELELALFLFAAPLTISKAIVNDEMKGLDHDAATGVSADASKLFAQLKGGEFPAECVAFTKSMTEVLDPFLHGLLKGRAMEIPRPWKNFQSQCYLANDVAECRESLL